MRLKFFIFFSSFFAWTALLGQIVSNENGHIMIGDMNPTAAKLSVINSAHGQPAFHILDPVTLAPIVEYQQGGIGSGNMFMNLVDGTRNIQLAPAGRSYFIAPLNFGIGVTHPQEKLHVAGTILHGGLQMISDKRLKKNITPLSYGLDEILNLKPILYEWNGKGGVTHKSSSKVIGILAQELQLVMPELVSNWHHTNNLDKSQSIDYLKIQSDAIQYVLINAIKEQHSEIEELKKQLELVLDKLSESGESHSVKLTSDKTSSSISDCVPNPTNHKASIGYTLSDRIGHAQIVFYDSSGKIINKIAIGTTSTSGKVEIDTTNLSPGTYVYSLIVNSSVIATKKMIVHR